MSFEAKQNSNPLPNRHQSWGQISWIDLMILQISEQ